MKTILKYTFATILIAFALNTNANIVTPPVITPLTEEAYIDDIPFSTENIFDSLYDVNITQSFDLSMEEFIQDIPFNTEEVVECSSDYVSNTFDLEEESYINDIPFPIEALIKM